MTDEQQEFQKTLIPLIRKVVPQMIAAEIAGVQPMSGPKGLLGYKDRTDIYHGYMVYSTDTDLFVRFEDYIGGSYKMEYVDEKEANIFLRSDDVFFLEDAMGQRERETFMVVKATKTVIRSVPQYEEGQPTVFSLSSTMEVSRSFDPNERWTWKQFKEEFD